MSVYLPQPEPVCYIIHFTWSWYECDVCCHCRTLSSNRTVAVLRTRTSRPTEYRSFAVARPRLWNSLPVPAILCNRWPWPAEDNVVDIWEHIYLAIATHCDFLIFLRYRNALTCYLLAYLKLLTAVLYSAGRQCSALFTRSSKNSAGNLLFVIPKRFLRRFHRWNLPVCVCFLSVF